MDKEAQKVENEIMKIEAIREAIRKKTKSVSPGTVAKKNVRFLQSRSKHHRKSKTPKNKTVKRNLLSVFRLPGERVHSPTDEDWGIKPSK